ncbi:putative disease resistance protein [Camellia lanceoleosa]|uniref:Disease resistance protein n=1 Tax=Camellia lanceoleosa TaxID=1840588 RepID=A0ACC0IG96_9ERIC|nr:putative disease resistance protein [Camellia lanceoleosa]
MVDAVVSSVVRRLGGLLIDQVIFLQGVRDEVNYLKTKLEYMLCFLKDAEEKQDQDNRIRKWVSDIRMLLTKPRILLTSLFSKLENEGFSKGQGSKLASKSTFASAKKQTSMG